jgi:enoyl-CoA hydratase/carnithine racemase
LLVEPEELESHVLAAADRLARKPPAALLAARRLMRGDAAAVQERTREEAAEFARCLASSEARAAFEAFLSRSRAGQDRS